MFPSIEEIDNFIFKSVKNVNKTTESQAINDHDVIPKDYATE